LVETAKKEKGDRRAEVRLEVQHGKDKTVRGARSKGVALS